LIVFSGRTLIVLLAILAPSLQAQVGGHTIKVLSEPRGLIVSSAVAGQQPMTVADASARLTVTAAGAGAELRARLVSPLPPGVTLQVHVTGSGVSSSGNVTLSTSAAPVVQLIPDGTTSLTITYTLRASLSAGPVAFGTVDVEFHLVPP
jgi:hypothetical protein